MSGTRKFFINIIKDVGALENKIIVYSKKNESHIVPVTARIGWRKDGKIVPIMYWTPDSKCFRIKHIFDMTPQSFLKNKGEGIRFFVKSILTDTAEQDSVNLNTCHESYLFFADNRFYGKNFIDGRYGHARKEYIPVMLDVFPDGGYEIIYFWVKNKRYIVEKTLNIEPHASYYAGGFGLRHVVYARLVNADDDNDPDPDNCIQREAALFLEVNKWFISRTSS